MDNITPMKMLVGFVLLAMIGCDPAIDDSIDADVGVDMNDADMDPDAAVDSGIDTSLPDSGSIDTGSPDTGVDPGPVDSGSPDTGVDSGPVDSGSPDTGVDSGPMDSGSPDTGVDSGPMDSGSPDTGVDSGPMDSGALDSGSPDTGVVDSGAMDSGTPDTGVLGGMCVEGYTPDTTIDPEAVFADGCTPITEPMRQALARPTPVSWIGEIDRIIWDDMLGLDTDTFGIGAAYWTRWTPGETARYDMSVLAVARIDEDGCVHSASDVSLYPPTSHLFEAGTEYLVAFHIEYYDTFRYHLESFIHYASNERCDDRYDNDGDGELDCDDADCARHCSCLPPDWTPGPWLETAAGAPPGCDDDTFYGCWIDGLPRAPVPLGRDGCYPSSDEPGVLRFVAPTTAIYEVVETLADVRYFRNATPTGLDPSVYSDGPQIGLLAGEEIFIAFWEFKRRDCEYLLRYAD